MAAASPARFRRRHDAASRACGSRRCSFPPTGEAAPDLASTSILLRSTSRCCATCGRTRGCGAAAWWSSLFWLVGAIAMSLLAPLVRMLLGAEMVVTPYPRRLRHRHRGGLRPRRLPARRRRIVLLPAASARVAAGAVLARSRLDAGHAVAAETTARWRSREFFAHRRRLARRRSISRGLAIAGGAVDRAVLRRRCRPGRRLRPPRPHHRRGQCAQRRLHGRRRASASRCCRAAASPCRRCSWRCGACHARSPRYGCYRRCRPIPLRDFLSIIFRAFYRLEVERPRQFRQGRPESPSSRSTMSASSTRRWRSSLLDGDPVFAIDSRHRQALVGASRSCASCAPCRSTRPSRWRRAR